MKARNLMSLLLVLALLVSLSGCGGSASTESMDYYAEMEAPQEMGSVSNESLTNSGSTVESPMPEDRKLIRTVNMDAETEDMDTLVSAIDEKITALGGYVQNREVYNGSAYAQRRYRRAEMTIRIPAENLSSFVEHVTGNANIISSNESVDDVTLKYVDTESRVKALETEQERLLALLEKAETMEDIMSVESRLTEVRYELESVASQLRSLENRVTYATVNLSISEVQEYTPVEEETTWQRITGGFMDSIEGITDGAVEVLVWVLSNSPYLVLWGAVGVAAAVLVRRQRGKRRAKKAQAAPEKPKETE